METKEKLFNKTPETFKKSVYDKFCKAVYPQLKYNEPVTLKNKELFDSTGLSYRTFLHYRDKLIEDGLLTKEDIDKRHSTYTLLDPNYTEYLPPKNEKQEEEKTINKVFYAKVGDDGKTVSNLVEATDIHPSEEKAVSIGEEKLESILARLRELEEELRILRSRVNQHDSKFDTLKSKI